MNRLEEKIEDLSMVLKKVDKEYYISLFISNLIKQGFKLKGEKEIYKILKVIKSKKKDLPFNLLLEIVHKVSPAVFMKKKKVGGVNYRIPVYLKISKRYPLGIKWLVSLSSGRKLGSFKNNLLKEILLIEEGRGTSLERKRSIYDLALVNRAYIKFL